MNPLRSSRRRWLPWMLVALLAVLTISVLTPLMHSESGLQIRVARQNGTLPDGFYLYQQLNAQGIQIKSITPDRDALIIKFDSAEQSLAAQKVLRQLLPGGFTVAHLHDGETAHQLALSSRAGSDLSLS